MLLSGARCGCGKEVECGSAVEQMMNCLSSETDDRGWKGGEEGCADGHMLWALRTLELNEMTRGMLSTLLDAA